MAGTDAECAAAALRVDARLLFWLEDRVFGLERTLPKFQAR
jgi:hypothetical protein